MSKEREILQWLLLENRRVREVTLMESLSVNATNEEINNLWNRYGFVKMEKEQFYSSGGKIQNRYSFEIHPHHREILEELLFKTKG